MPVALPIPSASSAPAAAPQPQASLSPAAEALAGKGASRFLRLIRQKLSLLMEAGRSQKPKTEGTAAGKHVLGLETRTEAGRGLQKAEARKSPEKANPAEPAESWASERGASRKRDVARRAPKGEIRAEEASAAASAGASQGKRTAMKLPQASSAAAEGTAGAAEKRSSSARRPMEARVFVVDLRPKETEREPELRRPAPAQSGQRELEAAAKGFDRLFSRTREVAAGEPQPGLSRAFRGELIPEIVQRAGIILREGGEGEIRLVLKPENLGSVRIRLHLGESSLDGRIVVDNYSVKELLEAHMEELKNALHREGYSSANIEVAVSGGGARGEAGGESAGERAVPWRSAAEAAEFERMSVLAWEEGLGYSTVNLVV